jgi:hypothetical protein
MRILAATLLVAAACGGPKSKHESAIVEGSDMPATCCCKTLPDTAEKDIVPNYAMVGRMECSTQHGDCVDDVQCNGSQQNANGAPANTGNTGTGDNGVPPPPDLPAEK